MVKMESSPFALAEEVPGRYVILKLDCHSLCIHISVLPKHFTNTPLTLGLDLSGATFWEFTDKLSPDPTRMRRIVQYPRNIHYSDISGQISPAWHQWLRHTRAEPPSLTEQSQDLIRQEQLKVLAGQADARWEAKPRLIDMPGREIGQAVPALRVRDPGGYSQEERPNGRGVGGGSEEEGQLGSNVGCSRTEVPPSEIQSPDGKRHSFTIGKRAPYTMKENKEDPWKKARGGPSEEWQPEAWDPNALTARR
jgi:NADH dehydrogenase [ubiquinone] 1 alpha subcomplex assembly factor 2